MALPTTTSDSWVQNLGFPSRLFGTGGSDYELYEEDDARQRRRTYHRTFRMPKEIEPDEIDAEYSNGVLEVRLPILEGATRRGESIEVRG